jgi:hypothetical protein
MNTCFFGNLTSVLRSAVSLLICLLITMMVSAQTGKRLIAFSDIPRELNSWLESQGINRSNFADHIALINSQTAERERDGEFDHLIFFMLQSQSFTRLPRIEPALSALEFIRGLKDEDRAKYLAEGSMRLQSSEGVPKTVRARIEDFLKAVDNEKDNERLSYFKTLLRPIKSKPAEAISAEYMRAMRFLYQKEFASREIENERRAAFVSSLYQTRGHSTDTQIEANFAIHTALAAIKSQRPSLRLGKVLIIGPGLDFAPRTDLIDTFGPQSYQPFAVADALIGLKLSDADGLQIHCVDINDRVIAHLRELRRQKSVALAIFSGVGDNPKRPLTDDFKEYFCGLGKSIGVESAIEAPARFDSHLKKSLLIRPEIVHRISVDRLNIVTERYESSPRYDLIVVTNVFPYFNQTELLLALSNIAAMLDKGGYLIHNELQTVPAQFVTPLGLPLEQARTVLIASSETAPLFDGVAIHRKN